MSKDRIFVNEQEEAKSLGFTAQDFEQMKEYGLEITTGPLAHLHSRAVVLIDEQGNVSYTEQVSDIVDEPNYEAALKAI